MSEHNLYTKLNAAPMPATSGSAIFKFTDYATAGNLVSWGSAAPSVIPVCATADWRFWNMYAKNSAATGTSRLIYARLYLTGGAGGETIRAFTNVESNAPTDTCNGAHISLTFGSSAGNITGQADAGRFTFHFPTGRTIGGTVGGVRSELWADGAAPAASNAALFTGLIGGDATGAAILTTQAHLMRIVTTTPDSGGADMISVGTSMGTVTGTLRILLNGVLAYIPYYSHTGHA